MNKIEQSEISDKYMDVAKELKKLWNIKVTVIEIVVRAHRWSPKGWKRDLRNWSSEEESSHNCSNQR